MPRVSTEKTEEEIAAPKKRAPRKRAPAAPKEAGEPAVRPRARRTSVHGVEPAAVQRTAPEVTAVARKAPTPLSAERRQAKRGSRVLLFAAGVLLVLGGAGVGIGMTDGGQIDVVAVVNDRNEKINRGEVRDAAGNAIIQNVAVHDSGVRANGGLVPADLVATPPPVVPETLASTSVSSTTSEVATSTVTTTPTEETAVAETVLLDQAQAAPETPLSTNQ